MTKIKIKTMVEITKEIEVDLPVYFKGSDTFDGGGGYDCVIRINEDGKSAHYLSVDFNGKWSYYLTSNVGQFFENGVYFKTTADEFFEMVSRFNAELNSIGKNLDAYRG